MKDIKNYKILLLILAAALLASLSACQKPPVIPDLDIAGSGGQIIGASNPTLPPDPTDPPFTDWDNEEDPLLEEDADVPNDTQVSVPRYAGATPMPLDPIDMPTPTPRPKLTFSYQIYDVTRLGISFEGPAGWEQDDSADGIVTLRQPEREILDNYRAFLSIEVRSVGSTLTRNDMRTQVNGIFDTLRSEYITWEPKVAAERTLFGQPGMYNDYRGILPDGTIVRGRVHVCSINKKTVTVHLSCPAGFNEDYMGNVYVKMRATLKETK